MEDKTRIYGARVDIEKTDIKAFYDRRASNHSAGYTTVLLGDNKPDYAEKWDKTEKDKIMPYLNSDGKKIVLDIGCGIGRWAESLVSSAAMYVGIDFSEEMIKVANKRFFNYENTYFFNDSFQGIFENKNINQTKYDIVIITGVSMYINDVELQDCYEQLYPLLSDDAIVYIEESVAVKERLTLNHIWSENLKDNYDAIYRTREEYLELMKPLLSKCKIVKEEYFDELDKSEMKETSHWYIIFKNKKCDRVKEV